MRALKSEHGGSLVSWPVNILSGYHFAVIFVTVLVPVGLPAGIGFLPVDCWWVEALIYLGVLLGWALAVVLVFSWLVEKEVGKASRMVSEQTDPLTDQVRGLSEQHSNLITDLALKLEDLEERTEPALEPLGGELPLRTVNAGMSARAGAPTASFSVTASGGGRWARIGRRFRRSRRKAWEILWGKR